MHILFISQQWWPEHGVTQHRMNWLVEGLHKRGHTVSVVTSPPHSPNGKLLSTDPEHLKGSRSVGPNEELIYRTSFKEYTNHLTSRLVDQTIQMVGAIPTIKRAITEKTPDLIVATAPPIPAVINAYLAHRKFSIPYVIDLRDAWPDNDRYIAYTDPSMPKPSLTRHTGALALRSLAPIYAQAIRQSDGLITTSRTHGSELCARWGLRTLVVRNLAGLDLSREPLPQRIVDDETLKVLYMGNIGRAQGLYSLLDTMEILKKRHVPVHLRLQGRGAHANFIHQQASARGLNIEVRKPIPSSEIQKVYEQADTLLVSLENWDSLEMTIPSKLFETMLTGRHITCIARGATAKIVKDANVGDVVNPGDVEGLANLWTRLQSNRELLDTKGRGRAWLAANAQPDSELEAAIDFLEATIE